jgi:hypothetical protein
MCAADLGYAPRFQQFSWLGVGSLKMVLSRPAYQPSPGCYARGNARRWAAGPCLEVNVLRCKFPNSGT